MKGPHQGGVGCSMGPPFLFIEGGGSHQGKVGFTPLYPGVNPTPHWLPVPHWGELKFPRVINPDSPLNDSRQLDWATPPVFPSAHNLSASHPTCLTSVPQVINPACHSCIVAPHWYPQSLSVSSIRLQSYRARHGQKEPANMETQNMYLHFKCRADLDLGNTFCVFLL